MAIVFRNTGTLDPASITTFGVSSKEKAGAIGFFGTGLKYAIAILLREGCRITVHTGGRRLEFGTERARVRVDDFTFVTMNGERLGFTTELGKTWETWAAFRELYCNCMDEDGEVYESDYGTPLDAGQDETVIVVEGEAFRDVWTRRSEVILNKEPLYRGEAVHICPGASEYLFYRGVRVSRLNKPSLFTYNIQRKIDLTEDRTVKYPFEVDYAIIHGWMNCDQESTVELAVTASSQTYERDLQFAGNVPSEAFKSVVGRLRGAMDFRLNPTAWEACRVWMMGKLVEAETALLDEFDQRRLNKAIEFAEAIGFPIREYPVRVTDFLGEGVLGQAYEGTILLSRLVLQQGTKMIAGTLIEEYLHLTYKCRDESRRMQNILIDLICSMGERITGEPL